MNRQAKREKKKTPLPISWGYIFCSRQEKKNKLSSSGWGSALPQGPTDERVWEDLAWSHPPPPHPFPVLSPHTHASNRPASEEVTAQFALQLPTWAARSHACRKDVIASSASRLFIITSRKSVAFVLPYARSPVWHHEYAAERLCLWCGRTEEGSIFVTPALDLPAPQP